MIDYMREPSCTPVLVTPTRARQRLDGQSIGTACDQAKIDAYATTMLAGDWQPGSLISRYAGGQLRDGCNRS